MAAYVHTCVAACLPGRLPAYVRGRLAACLPGLPGAPGLVAAWPLSCLVAWPACLAWPVRGLVACLVRLVAAFLPYFPLMPGLVAAWWPGLVA